MSKKEKLIIVTGLSGAGKHQVLYYIEDLGYFCVDNLPAPLIVKTVELLQVKGNYPYLAIGIDIRSGMLWGALQAALMELKKRKKKFEIIFLEAEKKELVRRFSETRRIHPLRQSESLSKSIQTEVVKLAWLKKQADLIIDTTSLTPPELRRQLSARVKGQHIETKLTISSFGYKYGLPQEADIIFDVRFLPNPFYVKKLKNLDGTNVKVKEYVMQNNLAQPTIKRLAKIIESLMPEFFKEGKHSLHIAIGCTGGQHRSVVIAGELKKQLSSKVKLYHRELEKKTRCSRV